MPKECVNRRVARGIEGSWRENKCEGLVGWKQVHFSQCIKTNKVGNCGKGRGCFQTELLPRLYLYMWVAS